VEGEVRVIVLIRGLMFI